MQIKEFGVEDWLNQWEKQAKWDIAGSSVASLSLEELATLAGDSYEQISQDLCRPLLNYGWIEGSPDFKEAVSQLYETVCPEQILQTNGATGANFLVLYSLLEPGDHVISMYPTYQQLVDIPQSLGAHVQLWPIREEKGWLPDLADLRQMVTEKTKMICINNANNPTGAFMDRAYLEELVSIAEEVGAYILADEVYQTFEEQAFPAIVDLYEKGISTNSLSKTYSLPGIRVGWIAANRELSDYFRKYRDYTMISAGVIDDALATYALQQREHILERNRQLVRRNLAILEKWVAEQDQVDLVLPRQVSTSFIRLRIDRPTEEFCLALLEEEGVLLVPGERFDMPGYARLGYCCQTEVLVEGLERLARFLGSNK
ncbi:aminotransferase [Streptococcus suis]|nr:aminotransferase [Streptococcus suis]